MNGMEENGFVKRAKGDTTKRERGSIIVKASIFYPMGKVSFSYFMLHNACLSKDLNTFSFIVKRGWLFIFFQFLLFKDIILYMNFDFFRYCI